MYLALSCPVLSSQCIQLISYSSPKWILRWNCTIIFQYLWSSQVFLLSSTSLLRDELICSWCNRPWGGEERKIWLVWQHCGVNLTFLFFFSCTLFLVLLLPLHPTASTLSLSESPALSLHHFLLLTVPSLLFTLSSLQEVLELAFSVLYESDEYLNFIAPDKHEVSQQWLLTVSDRMDMCDHMKRDVLCMQVERSDTYFITTAYLSGSFDRNTLE